MSEQIVSLTDLGKEPMTIPVGDNRYNTQNTKEAIALSSVGVPFKDPNPVWNFYTKEHPVSTAAPHAKPGEPGWRPGVIVYSLCTVDNTAQGIKPLVDAFHANTADVEFDALLEKLDEKIREERHLDASLIALVEEIKKKYRQSLVVHIRKALENWQKLWTQGVLKAKELLLVRSGIGYKLVLKYASAETRKKIGLS